MSRYKIKLNDLNIKVNMISKKTAQKVFDCIGKEKITFSYYNKLDDGNISGIFIDGAKYKNKPTKVFAYLGIPKEVKKKYPAIILVHGGGGTAYKEWVKKWTDRGYIAIAPDLEGHIPISNKNSMNDGQFWENHEFSGPCRFGAFDDINEVFYDQWIYHSVGALIRVCSLLNQMEIVDSDKIGINGISWGSILSIITVYFEKRIKFASFIYGCGFLYESRGIFGTYFANEDKKIWDPANFLGDKEIPMLWINGDSDFHFSLDIFCKTYKLVEDNSYLTIYPSMCHSHEHGWQPAEIAAFTDSVCKETETLRKLEICFELNNNLLSIRTDRTDTIKTITIHYIEKEIEYDKNRKPVSKWISANAEYSISKNKIIIKIPAKAKTYYINITDNNMISSIPVNSKR